MTEALPTPEDDLAKFALLSQKLGDTATTLAAAKNAHESQISAMKEFLLAHTGQQLPLKGYASFVGFNRQRENGRSVWTMIPVGRWDATPEDRKFRPGRYTICAVRENNMVEFSWPGQEDVRRTEASISQIWAATEEEIEAARVPDTA